MPLLYVMPFSILHIADVMSENAIKEAGARALAEALKANTTLHTLGLYRTWLGLMMVGSSLLLAQALAR